MCLVGLSRGHSEPGDVSHPVGFLETVMGMKKVIPACTALIKKRVLAEFCESACL